MSQDSKQIFPNIVYSSDASRQAEHTFRAAQTSRAEDQSFMSIKGTATTTTIPQTKVNASIDTKAKLTSSTTSVSVQSTKEKEKEKEKEQVSKEKEAEIWDGPLSRYNTYPSNKTPKHCSQIIEETLTEFEKDEFVDWEMDGFNVFGRVYYKFDMSEFMVNVYISNDNQYQSVIEIRRSSGDTFVHDEFFRRISKQLQERQVFEQKDDGHELDFDLSFELDPFSFDSLNNELSPEFQSPNSNTNNNNEQQQYILSDEDNDTVSTTNSAIVDLSTDQTSIEQLATELIDVVTDRWSYREVFRHSSGVLCHELKDNPLLLQFIATQDTILQRLMQPLTENLYDTLILRNILQVVKYLLQHKNPTVLVYENFANDIRALKQIWAEGPYHQSINLRFGKSQQVERWN